MVLPKIFRKEQKTQREEKDAEMLVRNNRGNTEVRGRGGAWGNRYSL